MKRPKKPQVIIGDSYETPLEKYIDHLEQQVKDLKEEFARDFVMPAMRANAIYEGTYLRPAILLCRCVDNVSKS